MKIAIMQPTYLPWLGYFELIDHCDLFVLFDDVQFVKKSWHQRNRIKTQKGELLLTVPVLTKGKRDQLIKDVRINNDLPWRAKHLASIVNSYQKAPFFDEYKTCLNEIYSKNYMSLSSLNIELIEFIKERLGIQTEIMLSSQFQVEGGRTERIINICKACKADKLYDAKGASDILDLNLFKESSIEIIFQEYVHPTYDQMHGGFISHLSALDLLLNVGHESLKVLRSGKHALSACMCQE